MGFLKGFQCFPFPYGVHFPKSFSGCTREAMCFQGAGLVVVGAAVVVGATVVVDWAVANNLRTLCNTMALRTFC